MKCPFCGHKEDKVIDSRPTEENEAIRRRRECLSCSKRFTTYEKIEKIPVMVVKKDKTLEAFDRNKLINGMLKACEKRPVNIAKIEKIASDIEAKIHNSLKSEVSSTAIGEMLMEQLRELDEVAYVRFASVYRQFKDVNTFMEEIKNLKKDTPEADHKK